VPIPDDMRRRIGDAMTGIHGPGVTPKITYLDDADAFARLALTRRRAEEGGLRSLDDAGSLDLRGSLQIAPGFYDGRTPQPVPPVPPIRDRPPMPRPRPTPILRPRFLVGQPWEVDEAFIGATEVHLHADTILIIEHTVRYLTILTRKLVVEEGAVITWSPRPKETPGAKVHPSKALSYSTTGESSGTHPGKSDDGGHGQDGEQGIGGFLGDDGPTLDLWVLELERLPQILLPGQTGIPGGRGQKGQDGGDGAKGLHAASGLLDCKRGPGRGGNGGNGGDGGRGGRGGDGGDAGRFKLATLEGNFMPVITAGVTLDLAGGQDGAGGPGGALGGGGRGGQQGNPDGWCKRVGGRDGRIGADGDSGPAGTAGAAGQPGEFVGAAITEDDWTRVFESPHIVRVDPPEAFAGDFVEIEGENFAAGDQVNFGGTQVDATFLTNSHLIVQVPADSLVGELEVRVARPNTNIVSNPFFLVIRPLVEQVVMTSNPPQTPRLGDTVTIRGQGFDAGTVALFRENWIEPETGSLSADGTWFRIVLPKPPGAYEEPGGTVTIKTLSSNGVESNDHAFPLAHILDSGFDPTVHAFGFANIYDTVFEERADVTHPRLIGRADRRTFKETYGEAEVRNSYLLLPKETEAFYNFTKCFWNEIQPGLSSAYAMLAGQEYWSGNPGLSLTTTNPCTGQVDCEIPEVWERRLTVAGGHILSRENIEAIGKQALRGLPQGENALRAIESMLRSQIGVPASEALRGAPVVMTVPWGPIGTGLAKKIADAHGLLPIAIEYPSRPEDDFEARLYFYNNWYRAQHHEHADDIHPPDATNLPGWAGSINATDPRAIVPNAHHFIVGQTVLIEDEQCFVIDIDFAISANLQPRVGRLTLLRGVNGTTAAFHDQNTPIYVVNTPRTQYFEFTRRGNVLDYVFSDDVDGTWVDPDNPGQGSHGRSHWPSTDEWAIAVLSLKDALRRDVDMPLEYAVAADMTIDAIDAALGQGRALKEFYHLLTLTPLGCWLLKKVLEEN